MATPPDRAVLLTPGAGTDASHTSLVALAEALAPTPVQRMDFPYRREGRKAPDRAPKLVAAVRAGAEELAAATGIPPERVVVGGRSMGGRMCSMAVAEGLPALGVVCIAYPLHPPGKPEKLRVDHLPDLTVPVLVVQGTKDPFGGPDELAPHFATVPGPVTIHAIDGARHDLKGADAEIGALVSEWVAALG